jgi:hypothetical protein
MKMTVMKMRRWLLSLLCLLLLCGVALAQDGEMPARYVLNIEGIGHGAAGGVVESRGLSVAAGHQYTFKLFATRGGVPPVTVDLQVPTGDTDWVDIAYNVHHGAGAEFVEQSPARFLVHLRQGPGSFSFTLDGHQYVVRTSLRAVSAVSAEGPAVHEAEPPQAQPAPEPPRHKFVKCHSCGGTGTCAVCHGHPKQTCVICWGSGNCRSCGGNGACPHCFGEGCGICHFGGHCQMCHGSGACRDCGGKGWYRKCSACHGSGQCYQCGGSGKIELY